jgi:hypothetical protein
VHSTALAGFLKTNIADLARCYNIQKAIAGMARSNVTPNA